MYYLSILPPGVLLELLQLLLVEQAEGAKVSVPKQKLRYFPNKKHFSIPHLTANCSCGSEDQKCRDRRREEQDGEGEGFWDVEPIWPISTFFVDDKTQRHFIQTLT